jgi:hypothetical protein
MVCKWLNKLYIDSIKFAQGLIDWFDAQPSFVGLIPPSIQLHKFCQQPLNQAAA